MSTVLIDLDDAVLEALKQRAEKTTRMGQLSILLLRLSPTANLAGKER